MLGCLFQTWWFGFVCLLCSGTAGERTQSILSSNTQSTSKLCLPPHPLLNFTGIHCHVFTILLLRPPKYLGLHLNTTIHSTRCSFQLGFHQSLHPGPMLPLACSAQIPCGCGMWFATSIHDLFPQLCPFYIPCMTLWPYPYVNVSIQKLKDSNFLISLIILLIPQK